MRTPTHMHTLHRSLDQLSNDVCMIDICDVCDEYINVKNDDVSM
jgi:hypothetical protein